MLISACVYIIIAFTSRQALSANVRAADARGISGMNDPRAVIDSLFVAGNFDSVLVLVPYVLDDARAKEDSMLIGRIILIRGRAELSARRYGEGMESLDLSIQISESAHDTLSWMEALGVKAFAITWQGRYDESIELSQKRLFLSQLTRNRASEAWARTALGYVYLQQGKLDPARIEYTLSIELFRAEGMKQAGLTPLIGLGRIYNTLQDEDAARDCYQQVLITARELDDLVQESHAVNNLGTLEYVYGDMSLAVQYFKRAYELSRVMGNLRGAITPASNTALAMSYLGNYEEAAKILSAAIRTCEEENYLDYLGMVTNRLGEVRILQKKMNAAARLYRRVLDMGSALSRKQYYDASTGLATALSRMDSTSAAVDLLETGLEDGVLVEEYEASINILLARCLREAGRPDEALARLEGMEKQILETDDIQRKISAAFEFSACFRAAGSPAEAYEWYHRALDFQDERRKRTDAIEWREVQTGNWKTRDYSSIVLEYPHERSREDRIEALFDIFQRFKARTLVERITEPRHQSGPESDFSKTPPISLSELQKDVLGQGELFLDFVVGNDRSYLFAVTPDTLRLVTLPGKRSDFIARVDLYSGAMSKMPSRGGAGIELAHMHELFGRLILGEISDLVRGATRILIAPDHYFNAVPFGALVLPATDEPAGERMALCESKEIHRVPSATALKWLRAKPGDPEVARLPGILAVAPGGGVRLKGAEKEIRFLRSTFSNVDIFTGDREEFFSGKSSMDIFHIATHVEIDDEKAWHSGILLGGVETPRRESAVFETAAEDTFSNSVLEFESDPYLRAGDIAAGNIPAELVVLSGCESAGGRLVIGEGLCSLTTAFLSAGASAVVATLWPVEDAVTADLMREFYRELAKGGTVAFALRRAQMAIRGSRNTAHPFYWAGFVVIGNGNITVNLEAKESSPYLKYVIVLIVLAAIFMAVRAMRRRKKID